MNEKQKYRILIGLIVLTILPVAIIAHPTAAMLHDVSSFMLYASSALGYLGIVLLLWMYVLGTRSVIGLCITDMASVMKLHKWLGKYGVLFVFAHPLAAALAYSQNVILYSIVPDFSTSYETYVTWGRLAIYALILIWFTSAIVRSRIAYRPWKYIHYVAYVALPLSLLHIPTIGSSFGSESSAKAYFFIAVVTWMVFSLLRIRHLFMLGKLSYTIKSQVAATEDVMYMVLTPNLPKPFTNKKGQFLYVQMNLLGESHPFSVLQHANERGEITVGYKKFGRFTHALANRPVGSTLYVDGPYGVFTGELTENIDEPTVFVAGGIGITPFIDHILTDSAPEQWLFYANKTQASSAFDGTLRTKMGDHLVSILSDDPNAQTETGYIRAELFTKYLSAPQAFNYFICGPPMMMESSVSALLSIGVPLEKIHTEEFSY